MPPNQPAPNPVNRQPKRLGAQDCAILVDYKLAQVIGGQTIGWPTNHRSQYINSRGGDGVSRPFVGVRIFVPRNPNDAATYFYHNRPSQDHILTLKLWNDTFTYTAVELPDFVRNTLPTIIRKGSPADRVSVIVLKLKDGHHAFLDGLGMPTTTASLADHNALFSGGNFGGVKPLLDLAAQREFRIIIPAESPQKYHGTWFLQDLPVGMAHPQDAVQHGPSGDPPPPR